jgi:Flp pilus assembly protein CpaB
LVAAVSLGTGLTVHALVDDATAARDRYGRTTRVAVVQRDLPAGSTLRAGDVALESRPIALVPVGALDDVPLGRAARVALVRGEVLVRSRVAPDGVVGVAAVVPDTWRAVAVPVAAGTIPPVRPGDRVDVLVTLATPGAATEVDATEPTIRVAEGALVVDVARDAVTIAVPAARVTRVAFGVAMGEITLALIGP